MSLGQTTLLILENLLESQEATRTPLGDIDAGSSHFGELFYHKDTGAGKHRCGVLPLAY